MKSILRLNILQSVGLRDFRMIRQVDIRQGFDERLFLARSLVKRELVERTELRDHRERINSIAPVAAKLRGMTVFPNHFV